MSKKREALEFLGTLFLILIPFGLLALEHLIFQKNIEVSWENSILNKTSENQIVFDLGSNSQIIILQQTKCFLVEENDAVEVSSAKLKTRLLLCGIILWMLCFLLFLWPQANEEYFSRIISLEKKQANKMCDKCPANNLL